MTIYSEYKSSKYWKVIDLQLKALEKNQDLVITTNRDYIIGALVKALADSDHSNLHTK